MGHQQFRFLSSVCLLASLALLTSCLNKSDTGTSGDSAASSSTPAPPTALVTTTLTSTSIGFTWTNNAPTALLVGVEMCSGSNCTNFVPVSRSPYGPTGSSHTETGLTASTIYRFRVRAVGSGGSSPYLTSDNIRTPALANTSLTTGTITATSINFGWTINEATATSMQVQRCNGASCTGFQDTFSSPLGPAVNTYTETGLTEASSYRFRVRAVTATGSSDWLTTSTLATLPNPPTGLAGAVVSSSAINVSWTDNSTAETGFSVERCTGSGCSTFTAVTGSPFAAGTVLFADTGLTASTTYRYRVRALSAVSTGDWVVSGNITTSSAPVAPLACTTPKTNVIDRGLKGSVAGVGRGLWSDTRIIPSTQNPAVAYYDGSSTGGTASIKVSWWDGSKFNVEHVASDLFAGTTSATWVKLAFLSTGIPIIVWTTSGTAVKLAMRSAALSNAAGVWTVGVIDSVGSAVNRAASISVSPTDSVAVAYITNSAATGRVRFLYCLSPCNGPTDFVAMTTTSDTVEANNVGANIMGISVGWCNSAASGTANYVPAVAYFGGTTLAIRYGVCTGAITTCRTATGWTGFGAITFANPVLIDMFIDPTVYRDTVKLLVKTAAASAMTAYLSTGGCHAVTALNANSNAVGATSAGTAWAKLLRDSSGLWHVVANDGTTSVVYMNSNASNFQTTTWNAAGTVETTTLPAAGSGAGSADIATTNGLIFSSYGLGAAPFNINMGVVNDVTTPSNNAAAVFYSVIPDTTGNVAMPLSAGTHSRNVSAALNASGRPAAAYVDFSAGAATGGRLKLAVRSGSSATSAWDVNVVPNTTNPLFPSLAFDHNGLPWISYYDSSIFRYFLVTNSSANGSGVWTHYQVPIGAKTASGTAPATDDTAVAMFYSGGVAQPVVIFMNSTAAGGAGVRAVRFNPTTNQFANIVTVDALGASFGTRLAADFDTSGNIVIAYYDLTTTTVKFNFTTNGGATWRPASAQISAATVGREGLSIKINPSNSRPAVSYYDRANNLVLYNTCTTALGTCGTAGNWTQTTAQSTTGVGVSGIVAANEQLLNTSLSFSAAGVPFIAYKTGVSPTSTTLTPGLAVTDSTTGFTPTLPVMLASAPAAGATPSTFYGSGSVAPNNFGMHGYHVSTLRGTNGEYYAIYVGPNSWLYATTCGD